MSYVKIGVAGPVGSGKTALIEALSRKMAGDYSIGVITNDIYTKEDAQFLAKNSVLPVERIIGVETGGCPQCLRPHPRGVRGKAEGADRGDEGRDCGSAAADGFG